jgi:hypothetical protein
MGDRHRDHRTALAGKPKLELADIFSAYQHLLASLSPEQAKVVRDLLNCRTSMLGGHVRRCSGCGGEEISYNSCRNRHCPKCQFLSRARWIEARTSELLPISYFHVVFTLPHVLNPLILRNKKALYELLFKSVADTMKQVAARRMNGAQIGFTAVLHTWGQNLMDHPHLHLIVPGGGLSPDGTKWVPTSEDYLLPTRILSQVFRGKFLSGLERLRGELSYPGAIEELKDPGRFKNLLRQSAEKPWVVYAKRPFAGPKQVINYLGNYTHRVAISNGRLIKIEGEAVHFYARDYRSRTTKIQQLHVTEFMRRFLLHTLPRGFQRIRHFGFMGSRFKRQKLELCRAAIAPTATPQAPANPEPTPPLEDWKQWLRATTGIDLTRCRRCDDGEMREVCTLAPRIPRRSIRPPPPGAKPP